MSGGSGSTCDAAAFPSRVEIRHCLLEALVRRGEQPSIGNPLLRLPSSAWRAGSLKASTRQTCCGKHCCGARTSSARFPSSGGTPTATTTPSPVCPTGRCRGGVVSSTTWQASIPSSSGSARRRPPRSIRSTACCWRSRGRQWSTQVWRQSRWKAPRRVCSSGCPTPTMHSSPPMRAPSDRCTGSPAPPPAWLRDGSPTPSGCTVRR
jgi:hypothetical protein